MLGYEVSTHAFAIIWATRELLRKVLDVGNGSTGWEALEPSCPSLVEDILEELRAKGATREFEGRRRAKSQKNFTGQKNS